MRRIWCLLGLLLCCVEASLVAAQEHDMDGVVKRFPGYHLRKLSELDSDARKFFVGRFPKNDPSVVHADFDGDGNPDYAIVLKDDKPGGAKLVVALYTGSRNFTTVYELDVTPYSGAVYIRAVPIGSTVSQTDAIETNSHAPRARLSSVGIRVNYFEQAELVLFWSKKLKKIKEIQTGD